MDAKSPALSPTTRGAVLISILAGVIFVGLSGYVQFATGLPWLFSLVLLLVGILGVVLGERALRGRRAPWAYLIAMWSVVGFCGFFTAPEVLDLPKLKQVTVELELKHGIDKAKAEVASDNLKIRAANFGLCVLFTVPFVGLCMGLARGRRDYETRSA